MAFSVSIKVCGRSGETSPTYPEKRLLPCWLILEVACGLATRLTRSRCWMEAPSTLTLRLTDWTSARGRRSVAPGTTYGLAESAAWPALTEPAFISSLPNSAEVSEVYPEL